MFLICLLPLGCGRKPKVKLPAPTPARVGAVERGSASWYGDPYHGRRTSNGEIYDMNALTAAHLSLPFDTIVRVRNLSNDRSVEVRINDRGPFVKGRLIDLSRRAAEQLEMIGPGTTLVEVKVVATPEMARARVPARPVHDPAAVPCLAAGSHGVQVGSFDDRANAESFAARLRPAYPAVVLSGEARGRAVHRVTVGGDLTRFQAENLLDELRTQRFDGFVTEIAESVCAGG